MREAIAAYLDKTEPDSVEKMSRKLNQLEKPVKVLMLIQGGVASLVAATNLAELEKLSGARLGAYV